MHRNWSLLFALILLVISFLIQIIYPLLIIISKPNLLNAYVGKRDNHESPLYYYHFNDSNVHAQYGTQVEVQK